MNKWEVKRDGVTVNWGTEEKGFPDARTRKILRADGHKIYVDGQLYKEPESKKK